MKDMIVTNCLSSCRPKMKRNENKFKFYVRTQMQKMVKFTLHSYWWCRRKLSCIGGGSWESSRRNIGRVLYLRLERRFFFLQLLRSSLQLKFRCRETTGDDVIASWNVVCARKSPAPCPRFPRKLIRRGYSTADYEHRSAVLRERMWNPFRRLGDGGQEGKVMAAETRRVERANKSRFSPTTRRSNCRRSISKWSR